MTHKMQQQWFEATRHMPEKGYYKHTMTDIVVWLSCYGYIFAISTYLITVNQCLKIFFSKNYVSLERSPLDKTIEKVRMLEIPTVNPLF